MRTGVTHTSNTLTQLQRVFTVYNIREQNAARRSSDPPHMRAMHLLQASTRRAGASRRLSVRLCVHSSRVYICCSSRPQRLFVACLGRARARGTCVRPCGKSGVRNRSSRILVITINSYARSALIYICFGMKWFGAIGARAREVQHTTQDICVL